MHFERLLLLSVIVMVACAIASVAHAEPRVALISPDGATPRLVREFMRDRAIPRDREPVVLVLRPFGGS